VTDTHTDPIDPPESTHGAAPARQRPWLLRPIFGFFGELRDDMRSNNGVGKLEWRDAVTFIAIAVLLTVFYYYCRPGYFRFGLHQKVADIIGLSRKHEYYGLLPYAYWAVMSVLMRMLVPCLLIWFVFRERARDYGYRLVGVTNHAFAYLLMFTVMIPIVYLVSLSSSFQSKYPFYDNAILGWDHFVLYQLCYGIQFVALESFFRGFIIFALFKRFGYYALFIMAVPYCMIHFGKPVAETFGAIIAGLLLGYLALKSRSWFYGAMLHWSIGITMDLFAIVQKGGFKH